jgi:U3 small nucleolar RNA-associated protein 11
MTKFSSLAKAVPRREHKERAQPSWHRGYGPLEKKKDYAVRSRKTHQRNAKLQLLRNLASNKNPDEYYRDMKFAHKTAKGTTVIEKLPGVTGEEHVITQRKQKQFVKQNASHNLNLLRHRHSIILKKIEKMKKNLHFLDVNNSDDEEPQQPVKKGPIKAKHVVFVSDDKEVDTFEPATYFDTDPSLASNRVNRPRHSTLINVPVHSYASSATTNPVAVDGAALKQYEALEKLLEKEKIVRKAIQEIEMALNVALEPQNIETFERDEEYENKNLTGKLKNVVAVKFKKERKK